MPSARSHSIRQSHAADLSRPLRSRCASLPAIRSSDQSFNCRSHTVRIGCAFDADSRMTQIDIDDACRVRFSLAGKTQFLYGVGDLYWNQSPGGLRDFDPSFAVELPPSENQVRIDIVRTRHHRDGRAWF